MAWDKLADDATLDRTVKALKANNFDVFVVGTGEEAKKRLLSMLQKGSEVDEISSTTLEEIGAKNEIENSGNYVPLRKTLRELTNYTKMEEIRKRAVVAKYCVGSVQAVTEGGSYITASASGNEIAPYSYGADKVILVVGTQKIVKSLDEAMKRLEEYVYPKEDERVHKTHPEENSSVNEILIMNREHIMGRTTIIFVKEVLGF